MDVVLLKVIRETLCPTWDETLVFDDIVVYGLRDELIASPPVVIVEIYDYDVVVSRQHALIHVSSPQHPNTNPNPKP